MIKPLKWVCILLVLTLLAGCGDAGNYIKQNYSLVDVTGQGKSSAKVYQAEGKDVPAVAKELAVQEKPKETSKESTDRMFLVYDNKVINVQKDPNNERSTLVEVDTIQYAKDNYDSSFLQGYITASLLQSLFGGGWFNSHRGGGYDYRGYTSSQRYDDYGKYQTAPKTPGGTTAAPPSQQAPGTSDRKGSFTKPDAQATPPSSDGSGSFRRNDGSSPTYKAPSSSSGGSSKPSTSPRSGSFKRK